MIGYIILLIVWSLLMIVLGIHIVGKDRENTIEKLKRSRDFHKDQREMIVEHFRKLVQENNYLKEHNTQLINENEKLIKQLDKQGKVTYNYYINK